jgi:hypothetical protein
MNQHGLFFFGTILFPFSLHAASAHWVEGPPPTLDWMEEDARPWNTHEIYWRSLRIQSAEMAPRSSPPQRGGGHGGHRGLEERTSGKDSRRSCGRRFALYLLILVRVMWTNTCFISKGSHISI